MIAVAGKCGDKTDCGDAVLGEQLTQRVVLEFVGLAREAVEIENNRRFSDQPRQDDIQVDRVTRPPLYSDHFAGVGGQFVALHFDRFGGFQLTAGERDGVPVLDIGAAGRLSFQGRTEEDCRQREESS